MQRAIGYVVKRFPRLSQTFVLRELLEQQRVGVPLTVFSYRPPRVEDRHEDYDQLGAEVVVLGEERAATAADESRLLQRATERLKTECARRGIEHLHAHFANVAAELALRACESNRLSYSVTTHARDIFHRDLDHPAVRRRLHAARAVVTISDFNQQHLREQFQVPQQRLHLIYNGVRLPDFALRSYDDREPQILAIGRLIEKKGFEDLIEATRRLRQAGLTPRVAIIGSGPLAPSLQRQIDSAGLAAQVSLLGSLSPREVLGWLARAQVFAAPCRVSADGDRDGLPTVLLEAMAVGAPCVATPVTGIPEAIEHGVTGLLVPERDPDALANAVGALLSDRSMARQLTHRARLRIEQRFDLTQNAASLRNVWNGCVHAS